MRPGPGARACLQHAVRRRETAKSPVPRDGKAGLSCRLRAVRAVYDAATPSGTPDSRAGMPPDLWASRRA
jgi:hypothetical protein